MDNVERRLLIAIGKNLIENCGKCAGTGEAIPNLQFPGNTMICGSCVDLRLTVTMLADEPPMRDNRSQKVIDAARAYVTSSSRFEPDNTYQAALKQALDDLETDPDHE